MSGLRVTLFGGLELWMRGRRCPAFESHKTAALFGYLAVHRGRRFSREHLAALLWPDADEKSGRANLRQALYNIRTTLPRSRQELWLVADGDGVGISSAARMWVDCEEFESLLRGREGGVAGSYVLARAVGLYRGDLLAGLTIRNGEPFEVWLRAEQERFRRAVLHALRRLVAVYTQRGEYRVGIEYAARLVELDPFSESAHRALMRLYGFAGERSRAVTHYRQLVDLLRSELSLPPQEETKQLYARVAGEGLPSLLRRGPSTHRPVIPFVGRGRALGSLWECWPVVAKGGRLVTFVEGEVGVGKTRLVRSFLDDLSSREKVAVAVARCSSHWPQDPYESLGGVLEQLLSQTPGGRERVIRRLSEAGRMTLSVLLSRRGAAAAAEWGPPRLGEAMAKGLGEILYAVTHGEGRGPEGLPVVLFLDDFGNAGPSTLRLLRDTVRSFLGPKVWFVATWAPTAPSDVVPLTGLDGEPHTARIRVERLTIAEVEEIARELVGEKDASVFSRGLMHASEGNPLALVMAVNCLWEEGILRPASRPDGRWRLTSEKALAHMATLAMPELVLRRLAALPPSARRLATVAAVVGEAFDAELLAKVEGELPAVVKIGLGLLMERWYIRQTPSQWASSGLEAGGSLWRSGARGFCFDFDHQLIARAILHTLPLVRRRVLHALVAAALRERDGVSQALLAHHLAGSASWLEAVRAAAAVVEGAVAVGAFEDAARTLEFAQLLVRSAQGATSRLAAEREWDSLLECLRSAAAMVGVTIEL